MTVSFGDRLLEVFDRYGRLCVGIDPHEFLLTDWGLSVDAVGVREFGLRAVEAAVGRVGIVKPQVAFFERFGSAGYVALEAVLAAARDASLLVIADVKRGDLGTSVEAYGQAWLSPGSPLEADAMTISAFQGVGSLGAPMGLAERAGKGVFVLAATSNPEGRALQRAIITDDDATRTVTRAIIEDVTAFNAAARAGETTPSLGSAGVVLGATLDLAEFGVDTSALPALPVLAPGFGHQGARIEDASAIYGALTAGVIVTESRSLLSAGPDGIRDAIARRADQVWDTLG